MKTHYLFFFVLLRSYKASKFSVLMLVASLFIATCGLSTVLIINSSAKQSYTSNNTLLISNVQYQVKARQSRSPITKQDYVQLRKLGFSQLIATAQTSSHLYQDNIKLSDRRIEFTGVDTTSLLPLLNASAPAQNADGSSNRAGNSGQRSLFTSMPFAQPFGILHPALLKQLESSANQNSQSQKLENLTLFSAEKYNDKDLKQVVYLPELLSYEDPSLGNDIIMDIGEFFRLFPKAKLNSLLVVNTDSTELHERLINSLKNKLPEHLMLVSISNNNQQNELTDSFHMNLLAMALLMFVVCLFIVINAVNLLINARMPWFKICRQLGISRYQIFTSQIVEIILLTFFASCIGIVASVHLSNIVAPTVQATLEGLYDVQVGFGNSALFTLFLQVFGISLAGSILATIAPFIISNKSLNSIKSNNNAQQNEQKWYHTFWICSLIFAVTAFLILHFFSLLWLLLLATALIILSGCCVLLANYPLLINIVHKAIPARFILLRLSSKQSIALSGKTKVACAAFFIAATSNIGMNLMVDSFRAATISWLETRLATDYYLYYDGTKNIQELANRADVEIYRRFENEVSFNGQKLQQHSYPSTPQFKRAMAFYKVDDDEIAWQLFDSRKAVFINQQFSFAYNYSIGDMVNIPHPSTKDIQQYVIQGIYYDFGNPHKQVLLPLASFDPAVSKSSVYSVNTDDLGLARFKLALDNASIDYQGALLSSKDLLAISKKTFDRTFIITDGLNIVTLLVAALSLACAIVVLMNDVRPQNMLIRSLGVSAFKTQMLALCQYMLLCLIALILATPFGILLSWVLIYNINFTAFHWTYPLQISFSKIVFIYAVSLAVVAVAISIPILRASKRPLIEDIRWLN